MTEYFTNYYKLPFMGQGKGDSTTLTLYFPTIYCIMDTSLGVGGLIRGASLSSDSPCKNSPPRSKSEGPTTSHDFDTGSLYVVIHVHVIYSKTM